VEEIDFFINEITEYNPDINLKDREILDDLNASHGFHSGLAEYKPTSLTYLPALSLLTGVGEIWVKDESQRFGISAIKAAGASYAIKKLLDKKPGKQTICTATDGNHGRAVAWTTKKFGHKSVVFVPGSMVKSRIEDIAAEGAKVIRINGKYDEAVRAAHDYANKNKFMLVQDTAWPGYTSIPALVMAGYHTVIKEIEDEMKNRGLPYYDVIFLQCGVGSWPSSVVHYYRRKYGNKSPQLVCVEPWHSDCIIESVKNRSVSETKKDQQTIMAGLNCGMPSVLAWKILNNGTDAFLSIPDSYAVEAMKALYYPNATDPKILSGESGAAGLAGLMAIMNEPKLIKLKNALSLNKKSRILVFNTEGITDAGFFNEKVISDPPPPWPGI